MAFTIFFYLFSKEKMTLTAAVTRPSRLARLFTQGLVRPGTCARMRTGSQSFSNVYGREELAQSGVRCGTLSSLQAVNVRSCSSWSRPDNPKDYKVPGKILHHDDPPAKSVWSKRLHRQKLSSGFPREAHFHVLGQGSPGGPRSLLLFTDCEKFLFNCGEGTQRLCREFAEAGFLTIHCSNI